MNRMYIRTIASALLSMQAIIPAFAVEESGHDAQQPPSVQEHPLLSSNSGTTEMTSNKRADQAPKFGHIGKDQTQSFRFATGSRF